MDNNNVSTIIIAKYNNNINNNNNTETNELEMKSFEESVIFHDDFEKSKLNRLKYKNIYL
jgi:hypothetical protein